METVKFKLFLDVAASGSFSRAATLAGTTQSSVSKAVSQLETELGARLFDRTGRGASLTAAGRALLPRAHALLADVQSLSSLMADLTGAVSGTVRFAVQPSVSWPLVHDLLVATRARHPEIRLLVDDGTTHQIEEWLAEGRCDLGVMSRVPSLEHIESWPLFSLPLLLASKAGAPQTARVSMPFSALADIALIAPTAPNGGRMLLEEEARRRGMRLNIVQEVNSASLVKRLTARGDFCMVATWPWVAIEVASGELSATRIVNPVLRQTFCLAVGGRRPPSAAVRAVADIVRELMPSRGWQTSMGSPTLAARPASAVVRP
ncbi:LysR family transcriptional regulator [Comamonadaceae bacterium G21597-S1]|nr:LysR family transcriptional regulator [Comamonadaceae bacterium G21597-S1]